jgi:fimbrial chaperone protein
MAGASEGVAGIARHRCVGGAIAALLFIILAGSTVRAQPLSVLPVSIQMSYGQMATALTVINQGDVETTVQVRPFAWNQPAGKDELTLSDQVMASPPLVTVAPKATQIVRLVLRQRAQGQEATYRVLIDQIPPPAAPGTVRVALRLSIPIFAEPTTRSAPHVLFDVESDARQAYLVAVNDGSRHDTIRDISLTTSSGSGVKTEGNVLPYVLAGATRRWRILAPSGLGGILHLSARADGGVLDQPVSVGAAP